MSDQTWILRVEGVNFSATVTDTNDLSTIRGSGLALLQAAPVIDAALRAAGIVEPVRVFAGASQAAFRFAAGPETAHAALTVTRAALGAPGASAVPLRHLSFVADLAEVPKRQATEDALRIAEARNRAQQMRNFTIVAPPVVPDATVPDDLDHARPAETIRQVARNVTLRLSRSVAERRDYGRVQRAGFYAPFAPGGGALPVCSNFEDMVADPPPGLPVAVRGKLAFLYGDGNGFGTVRDAMGTEAFARALEPLQADFLRRLSTWLAVGVAEHDPRRAVEVEDEGWQARFETLLWGGDDFLFVMPAWLGLHVLAQAEAATRPWRAGTHRLTVAFGLAICDRKTPVRIAQATARALSDLAKDAAKAAARGNRGSVMSAAAIQPFESQSPMDAPLAVQRSRLFSIPVAQTEDLGRRLVLRGDALAGLAEEVRRLTDGTASEGRISPQLLHRAIAVAREARGGIAGPAGAETARQELADALGRYFRPVPEIRLAGFAPRGAALDLCLLAMLRDYCTAPAAGDLPPWPPGSTERRR